MNRHIPISVRIGLGTGLAALLGMVGSAAPQAARPPAATPVAPFATTFAPPSATTFTKTVQPFFVRNCYTCHSAKLSTAGLNLEAYADPATLEKDRERWESILSRIESGAMPPKGLPRPDAASAKSVTDWLEAEFKRQDKLIKPDPGHVTARRLNRSEYNNTVRDLLGVDFHPADDFPQDDSGYGFDNIGDVLSLSPALMEKYLTAAERISRIALYGDAAAKPTMVHYQPFLRRPPPPPSLFDYDESGVSLPSAFNLLHQFPADAEYLLKITLNGQRPNGSEPVTLNVSVDGKPVQQFAIDTPDMEGQSRQFRTRVAKGEHLISLSFLRQFEGLPATFKGPNPSKKAAPAGRGGRGGGRGGAPGAGRGAPVVPPADADPAAGDPIADPAAVATGAGRGGRGPAVPGAAPQAGPSLAGRVDALDIGGPFDAKAEPPTESLRKIFVCGHSDGKHTDACPRRILSDLARRAYRRPAAPGEVDALVRLYTKVRSKGDSFNEGIATSIQYLLASPDFLFRIENASSPSRNAAAASAIRPVGQYELASRLSYFLWSSMPDDELLRVAGQGGLHTPAVLDAQVRRMLKDPKSRALVENFAGQWLQIRNMDVVKPDWERFEQFDALLRVSAKRETELFLSNMIQEDRSILDMIDGKYTFLNERLARFYKIPGVTGPEFRKVDLTGNPERSGILTQASVLTVSSYATRTSPVLRGKWILENILNTPPPPPPPDVPDLDATEVGAKVSLREQLEKHRANPACATCHGRMDPLGFALENYNAIGEWRTQDGRFPIDASGKLPDGRTFTGSAGLKSVLLGNKNAFAQCVTEKLLIYSLGRGLERFDKPVVAEVVKRAAPGSFKFSDIVLGIVHSMPFQMQKGERKPDVRHT